MSGERSTGMFQSITHQAPKPERKTGCGTATASVQDVRVDHCRADILVTQDFLEGRLLQCDGCPYWTPRTLFPVFGTT